MEFGRAWKINSKWSLKERDKVVFPFRFFLSIGPRTIKRGSKFLVDSWLKSFPINSHKNATYLYSDKPFQKILKHVAIFVWPVIPGCRPVWLAIHRKFSRYDRARGRSYRAYTAAPLPDREFGRYNRDDDRYERAYT
jgi:hypothetical protein